MRWAPIKLPSWRWGNAVVDLNLLDVPLLLVVVCSSCLGSSGTNSRHFEPWTRPLAESFATDTTLEPSSCVITGQMLIPWSCSPTILFYFHSWNNRTFSPGLRTQMQGHSFHRGSSLMLICMTALGMWSVMCPNSSGLHRKGWVLSSADRDLHDMFTDKHHNISKSQMLSGPQF